MRLFVAALVAVVLGAPDPIPAAHERFMPVGRSLAPGNEGPVEPAPDAPLGQRATGTDQPDAEPTLNQTHAVYFVPRDRPDESLDDNGTLSRSITGTREWFARETSRNGLGARRPRMDRLAGGGWDITFVRGDQDAAAYTALSVISSELTAKGLNDPNKRYLIYAALSRGGICGEGFYPLPGFPTSGRFSAVYLDSDASCGARDFGGGTAATAGKAEAIAAHEWLHNEGVASPLSPHHCPGSNYHVCTVVLYLLPGDMDTESPDVLFPYINARLSAKVLDRDLDDYLDHSWPHLANLRASPWLE